MVHILNVKSSNTPLQQVPIPKWINKKCKCALENNTNCMGDFSYNHISVNATSMSIFLNYSG